MKEIKHYICEICGTEYREKTKARECEKAHKKPKKIQHSDYHSLSVDASGYPAKIHVEMSDGKIVLYKKLRACSEDDF